MPTPFSVANEVEGAMRIAQPGHVLLRQARTGRDMSLQQVADACGINIRQYQKFESGERDIAGCAFATALQLCHVLGLDPWLFLDAGPANAATRPSLPSASNSPEHVRRLS